MRLKSRIRLSGTAKEGSSLQVTLFTLNQIIKQLFIWKILINGALTLNYILHLDLKIASIPTPGSKHQFTPWRSTDWLKSLSELKTQEYIHTSLEVSQTLTHTLTMVLWSQSLVGGNRSNLVASRKKWCHNPICGSMKQRRRIWRFFLCILSCHHFPLRDVWLCQTQIRFNELCVCALAYMCAHFPSDAFSSKPYTASH